MPIVPGMCAASYFGAGRPSITSAPAAMAAASCSGANGATAAAAPIVPARLASAMAVKLGG